MEPKNLSDYPQFLKVVQFAELMQLSRVGAYSYIHRKGFPMFRLGKSIRINRDSLVKYLEELQMGEENS